MPLEPMTTALHGIAAAIFVGGMLTAAVSDLRAYLIPNWVSIAIALAFFPAAFAKGFDGATILRHVGIGAATLLVGFVLSLRWIGGGDAKLLAASAVWVGVGMLMPYLFLVAVAGGIVTLLLIGFRRLPLPARLDAIAWVHRLHAKDEGVPYGIGIAVAALIIFPRLPVVGWA